MSQEMDDKDIEFYLNEGNFCSSTILDILRKQHKHEGCLCGLLDFEVLPLV